MWALYAPAATPKPIVDKLSAALKQVVDMPDVKASLLDFGDHGGLSSASDELRSMDRRADIESWKQIARGGRTSPTNDAAP